jgi:hypothetical protein
MGFDKEINNIFNCYRLIQEQQMFNPWPNEAIPSGDDTRIYRNGGSTSDIPRSVDYSQLVQKYIGDRQAFAKLPQDEQVRRMTSLINDYASQANLSSTWANDVRKMSIIDDIRGGGRKIVFPDNALSNFDYSNRQMQSYNAASPEEKAKMDKSFEDFWKEKENISNYERMQQQQKDSLPQKREEFDRTLKPIVDELTKLRKEKPQGWEQKQADLTSKLETETNKLRNKYSITDPTTGKPVTDPKEIEKLIKSSEERIKGVQISNTPSFAPTGASAQPSSVPNASSQPQGLKPQGSSTGTSAQPSSVPSSSLQPQGSSTGLTSQLAKAADVAYSLNPTTAAPYAVGKALYNAGPDYAKAAYQSMANDPAIKPIANLNTPNIAGRALSNTAQAIYNSPQMTPVRNVVDGARNAYDAYSNYANTEYQRSIAKSNAQESERKSKNQAPEEYYDLSNYTPSQKQQFLNNIKKPSPLQTATTSTSRPQAPVQSPQPQRQQPVQPQQPQRQTVYGTNIDPSIPNARRVTSSSTPQPVQPQQQGQRSYTSGYLPSDSEYDENGRLRTTPFTGRPTTATKYY